jgi:carboxymethylenebutenolidase
MCHSADAEPPLPPGARAVAPGEPVTLTAADGNRLLAWQASAAPPSGAAVVILPDLRGLFPFYQRLAEHFATVSVDALAIDYFGRTAGTEPRGADFDHQPHVRQTTYEGVNADVAAGVEHLRASAGQPRAIFTVGFCFGGSYSFIQAANGGELGLAGVIGFYGGMRQRSEGAPTPITLAPRAQVPVLGLFGGADQSIPPEKVEEFRAGLAAAGVEHSIHVYPGAPHSFFDRSYADHRTECVDAWQRVLGFIDAHRTSDK